MPLLRKGSAGAQIAADLDVTPGPSPYLQAKVAAGHTGMKVGKGFRHWTPEDAAAVQQRLDQYLVTAARERIRLRALPAAQPG